MREIVVTHITLEKMLEMVDVLEHRAWYLDNEFFHEQLVDAFRRHSGIAEEDAAERLERLLDAFAHYFYDVPDYMPTFMLGSLDILFAQCVDLRSCFDDKKPGVHATVDLALSPDVTDAEFDRLFNVAERTELYESSEQVPQNRNGSDDAAALWKVRSGHRYEDDRDYTPDEYDGVDSGVERQERDWSSDRY